MSEDFLDHDRVFDARDHFHCTASVLADLDLNLEPLTWDRGSELASHKDFTWPPM